jgi:hypothetical protein
MKTYVVELKYTAYATRIVIAETQAEAEAIAHVSPLDDGCGEWTTDDAYEYKPERVRAEEWERNNDQPSREG